ncbi:40S ribosomal protein S8 [Diplonema papillatum]|nr:40S ribosomal protein S8 [Diplonema papillatum]|eukprot:gene6318-9680_t
MGITRSSLHKRRVTGGKRKIHQKKRKYELGRLPANTKMVHGDVRVTTIRARGGNRKFRALRLDTGNFAWASQSCTKKSRIIDVVYNATANELISTKTLVKGAIVAIDSAPFRQWYYKHYGKLLGKKRATDKVIEETASRKRRWASRMKDRALEKNLSDQVKGGRVLARIASRPGQVGRADGYILEGAELAFYLRKVDKKKHKKTV